MTRVAAEERLVILVVVVVAAAEAALLPGELICVGMPYVARPAALVCGVWPLLRDIGMPSSDCL